MLDTADIVRDGEKSITLKIPPTRIPVCVRYVGSRQGCPQVEFKLLQEERKVWRTKGESFIDRQPRSSSQGSTTVHWLRWEPSHVFNSVNPDAEYFSGSAHPWLQSW